MKSAFAKLMVKNPVESSHIAFRAGGNGVPILTRASASSTTGYQTMGTSKSFTTLGAYRMGDDDGNAAVGAIYPNDIFGPPGQPDREYPERTFACVGNNVFQPDDNGNATIALLRRLGDQQFKATSQAPFEDYRAQQKLALDLEAASRNASLSELGASRDIIRNIAAQRRQQNEDDYLRKILDAGGTPESARKEIEDVRNANALFEARKVDDREYQAKSLIQRMSMARGVTPMTREPLNQSSSIDNPQRSQAMSQAMGMPGEGFGTSPLDMNRQFMTPEFYKKFLRKSAMTQESADEQSAFNSLLSRGQLEVPSTGSFSFATLKGQERQNQVELVAEGLESRLESLRARGRRIKKPLPQIVVAKDILKKLYDDKTKKPGSEVLFSLETIQEMAPLQLLIALNTATVVSSRGHSELLTKINEFQIPRREVLTAAEGSLVIKNLKELVQFINKEEANIEIPFASASVRVTTKQVADILTDIKTDSTLKASIAAAHKQYVMLLVALGTAMVAEFQKTALEQEEGEYAVTTLQKFARGRRVRKQRAAAGDETVGPTLPANIDSMTRLEVVSLMGERGLAVAKGERIKSMITRLKAL